MTEQQPPIPPDPQRQPPPHPLNYMSPTKPQRTVGEQILRGCLIALLVVIGLGALAFGLCVAAFNGL